MNMWHGHSTSCSRTFYFLFYFLFRIVQIFAETLQFLFILRFMLPFLSLLSVGAEILYMAEPWSNETFIIKRPTSTNAQKKYFFDVKVT